MPFKSLFLWPLKKEATYYEDWSIREGKVPPDHRVPLTPAQCKAFWNAMKASSWWLKPSPIRAFSDEAYTAAGVQLQPDLSDCDVLVGVKEVPSRAYFRTKLTSTFRTPSKCSLITETCF